MIFDLDKIIPPSKITPDPIVETVVEIRFESQFSSQKVADKLLVEFSKDFPESKDLPLAEFPQTFRDQDPQLRYVPFKQLFKSSIDKVSLQFGGRSISILNKNGYLGWSILKDHVQSMMKGLRNAGVVSKYERIGIRYLNVFDANILKKMITVNFSGPLKKMDDEKIDFRFIVKQGDFQAALKLSNDVRKMVDDKIVEASLIDIDSFIEGFPEGKIESLVEDLHLFEKKIFFALMDEEYVKEYLSPVV